MAEFSPATASAMGLAWAYHEHCRAGMEAEFLPALFAHGRDLAAGAAPAAARGGLAAVRGAVLGLQVRPGSPRGGRAWSSGCAWCAFALAGCVWHFTLIAARALPVHGALKPAARGRHTHTNLGGERADRRAGDPATGPPEEPRGARAGTRTRRCRPLVAAGPAVTACRHAPPRPGCRAGDDTVSDSYSDLLGGPGRPGDPIATSDAGAPGARLARAAAGAGGRGLADAPAARAARRGRHDAARARRAPAAGAPRCAALLTCTIQSSAPSQSVLGCACEVKQPAHGREAHLAHLQHSACAGAGAGPVYGARAAVLPKKQS